MAKFSIYHSRFGRVPIGLPKKNLLGTAGARFLQTGCPSCHQPTLSKSRVTSALCFSSVSRLRQTVVLSVHASSAPSNPKCRPNKFTDASKPMNCSPSELADNWRTLCTCPGLNKPGFEPQSCRCSNKCCNDKATHSYSHTFAFSSNLSDFLKFLVVHVLIPCS